MKYYIYISDAKLDILRSQLPKKLLAGLKAEIDVKLPFASAKLSSGKPDETRVASLLAIEKHLCEAGLVGDLGESRSYFRGSIPMIWGACYGRPEIVYFTGRTQQGVRPPIVVGLGGSMHHLIGASKGGLDFAHSYGPDLVDVLAEMLDMGRPERSEQADAIVGAWATDHKRESYPPAQKLEFLAKRLLDSNRFKSGELLYGGRDKPRVIIGTPLFVALAE